MATQTKDGRWKATKLMPDGTRKAWYSRISAQHAEELKAGTASSIPDETFHEWAKAYWEPRLKTRRPNTVRRYADVYKRYIYPAFGHRVPSQIRHSEIQSWANHLGKSPATVQLAVSIISQVFTSFAREGLISANPAKFLTLPRIERRERTMSVSEMKLLLGKVEGTPLAAPVFLAGVLGMRRGEACGLTWKNIDLDARRISVREQRVIQFGARRGKKTQQAALKTEASSRTFVLPKGLWDAFMRVADLDHAHVATMRGKAWNPEELTGVWAKKRDELGFPGWHFHDLRHGAAGILAALGVDLLTIAAILGQKSVSTTQLYAAAREETATKGLSKVGRALFPKHG